MRLTQRTPDWWESARFRALFVASSWFRQNGVSRPSHQRVTQAVGTPHAKEANPLWSNYNMKIDTNILLSIIQTIAIIFSLLFAAVELKRAREASRGNAYHAWISSINSYYSKLAETPDLAEIYWRGRSSLEKLKPDEVPQFYYLCVELFSIHESLHVQHSEGLIPDSYMEPWIESLKEYMNQPGVRAYWKYDRERFNPVFVKKVNEAIAAEPAPMEIHPFLKFYQDYLGNLPKEKKS
jgi:hypothetical protein